MLFVSDHDSTVNHQALERIAERRGIVLLPGVELSPSWGHFNAYPLTPGLALAIDTSVAAGVAPGGFNPRSDLLEINESAPEDDEKVLHRYYLSAGTDTHDVWNSRSGHVRVLADVSCRLGGRFRPFVGHLSSSAQLSAVTWSAGHSLTW